MTMADKDERHNYRKNTTIHYTYFVDKIRLN